MSSLSRRDFAFLFSVTAHALRAASHPSITKANWPKQREHILAGMREVMGAGRDAPPGPPEVVVLEEVPFDRFIRKKITFASGDGDAVPAYLFTPVDQKGRRRAVLCLHQTVSIGKGEPSGVGGKRNLHYASELAARGFITLAPDYPNFGEYKIDAYAMGYVSATMKGVRNHRRALDLLASMQGVDGRRIGAIGHSLGGHNALFLAAFDTRVAAVVTSCGFTSFAKYYGGNLTGWSHAGYMPRIASMYDQSPAKMPFDFPGVLQAIAPRALFINAPLHDSNFDVTGVDDCVHAAQIVYAGVYQAANRVRVLHPDCGHDFPTDVRAEAYEFLHKWL